MQKFYFFDLGVTNALTGKWARIETSGNLGQSFEHFIFNEIHTYLKYTEDDRKIYFWRSKNHQEVDFIIGDNMAVEVKSGQEIRPRDLKGLKALSEEVPLKYKIIVSLSEKSSRLIENQFLVLPYKVFLKKLFYKAFFIFCSVGFCLDFFDKVVRKIASGQIAEGTTLITVSAGNITFDSYLNSFNAVQYNEP